LDCGAGPSSKVQKSELNRHTGHFGENQCRDLERRFPRGGIAYFWGFSILRLFLLLGL
jgi:hypothetical protein